MIFRAEIVEHPNANKDLILGKNLKYLKEALRPIMPSIFMRILFLKKIGNLNLHDFIQPRMPYLKNKRRNKS